MARRQRSAGVLHTSLLSFSIGVAQGTTTKEVIPIIANRFSGATVTRSRPLCPWPAQAVYNGTGDVNVASSFTCVQQVESASSINTGDIVQIKNSLVQRALILPNR